MEGIIELPPSHARAGQRICERHATTADMYAKKAHIGRMKDPLLQNTHGYPIRPTASTILSQNDEFLPPFAIFGDRSLCHHMARLNPGNTGEIGPLRGAARGVCRVRLWSGRWVVRRFELVLRWRPDGHLRSADL